MRMLTTGTPSTCCEHHCKRRVHMELTGLQLYEDNVTVTCLKKVDVNCEDDTFLFFSRRSE